MTPSDATAADPQTTGLPASLDTSFGCPSRGGESAALERAQAWPGARCPDHVFDAHGAPAPLLVRRRPGQLHAPDPQAAAVSMRLQPVHRLDDGVLYGVNATLCGSMGDLELPAVWAGNARASAFPGSSGRVGPSDELCRLLQEACTLAASLPAKLLLTAPLPSGTACGSDLVRQAGAALNRAGLTAPRLEIALEDASLADAGAAAMLSLSALRDLHIELAMDFGADVSMDLGARDADAVPAMVRKLRRLPLTCVRLRPGLLRELSHSRDTRTLVAAAIRGAHGLGATVCALGVATALQRDILADLHCDTGMGPVFGMPMHAGVFRTALLHGAVA